MEINKAFPCLGSCPHEPEFIKIKMVRGDTNQGKVQDGAL